MDSLILIHRYLIRNWSYLYKIWIKMDSLILIHRYLIKIWSYLYKIWIKMDFLILIHRYLIKISPYLKDSLLWDGLSLSHDSYTKWSGPLHQSLEASPTLKTCMLLKIFCNRLGRQGRTGFPQLGHENFIYLFIYRSYARCGCLIYARSTSWMDLF